ncbi:hypothetical protein [Streptomyces sp. NPDC046727]|uniref:hypothetical protein n=1 Tax=Streptomyces sp. NPDC046727 TaxID=3155373 RepID=UPI0034085DF5
MIERSPEVGNVADATITDQVQVLNSAFADTGFSFSLASVDRTVNRLWYDVFPGSAGEDAMKHTLHRGGAAALDIYIAETYFAGTTGWATFPWDYPYCPAN